MCALIKKRIFKTKNMFLNHLNLFISLIILLLFSSKRKHHTVTESLFLLFSVFYFTTSLLSLLVSNYDFPIFWLLDTYAVVCENILLSIPVITLYLLNQKQHKTKAPKTILLITVLSLLLYLIHWLIARQNAFVFYHTNIHLKYNILFQIFIDFALIFLFIYKIKKDNKKSDNLEVFDGNFKKYFIISFGLYYFQDVFILVLFYLSNQNIIFSDTLYSINTFFNTLIGVNLIFLAIYTNWLKEYNYIRISLKTKSNVVIKNNDIYLSIEKLKEITPLNWNEISSKLKEIHPIIIGHISNNDQLTKTEKLYAFLDYFDFANKELSEILNVSVRTIETNFYRMRLKYKKQSD